MTDEEFAAANSAYDADPGVEPDGWSFIRADELQANRHEIASRCDVWRRDGMTWFCAVEVDWPERGVWLAVWKRRPRKQAPLNPPYTATATAEGGR